MLSLLPSHASGGLDTMPQDQSFFFFFFSPRAMAMINPLKKKKNLL